MEHGEHLSNPDVLLSLATAMGGRAVAEKQAQEHFVSERLGIPPQHQSAEFQTAMSVGITAIQLRMIADPEQQMTLREAVEEMIDGKTLDTLVVSSGVDTSNPQESEEMLAGIKTGMEAALSMMEGMGGVTVNGLDVQARLHAAYEVAESHGVAVETVFEQDDLYFESVRLTTNPEALIDDAVMMANDVKKGIIKNMAVQMFTALEQIEGAAQGLDEDEINREIALRMHDIEHDEEMQVILEQTAEGITAAYREGVIFSLGRIWGLRYNDLPEELQQKINGIHAGQEEGQDILPAKVREQAMEHVKAVDRVALYCMEKGWDPNNLSAVQLGEARRAAEEQEMLERLREEDASPIAGLLGLLEVLSSATESAQDEQAKAYCQSQGWDFDNLGFDQRLELRQHLRGLGFDL